MTETDDERVQAYLIRNPILLIDTQIDGSLVVRGWAEAKIADGPVPPNSLLDPSLTERVGDKLGGRIRSIVWEDEDGTGKAVRKTSKEAPLDGLGYYVGGVRAEWDLLSREPPRITVTHSQPGKPCPFEISGRTWYSDEEIFSSANGVDSFPWEISKEVSARCGIGGISYNGTFKIIEGRDL